jgi:hypothetical protein
VEESDFVIVRMLLPEAYVQYSGTGPHSKSCNLPVSRLATADEGDDFSPTQSMQRNLRPPVLTSTKCIGLRHLGQIGGGVFLGMAAYPGSGRSITELSVTDGWPESSAAMR